jgi:hypothetical protein
VGLYGRDSVCLNRSILLSEPVDIVRIGVGPDDTIRVTAHHWRWWVVVRYQLMIGLFEFKFDHLNITSTV